MVLEEKTPIEAMVSEEKKNRVIYHTYSHQADLVMKIYTTSVGPFEAITFRDHVNDISKSSITKIG